jgi:predicted 3-demethylubiquinone-9 3-methyltransferase (glyoxalase superfamily)
MELKPSSKIFTHLWYAREAEEAASFYASVFPDSRVDLVTPLLSDTPSGPPGSVKVVDFTLFGQRFQAISGTRSSREEARRRRAAGSSTASVSAGRSFPPPWTR